MKLIFKPGDEKEFRKTVTPDDCAIFNNQLLHPVYATFALARDMEWTSRLFFLEMREADEEGVGTHLTIEHRSPAFVGEEVIFTARVERVEGMDLFCAIEARTEQRLIATGRTGQKMLKKEKLKRLFTKP
ncbi:MAG: thioesterase family protein [Bacteroidota bacterium]